MTFDDFMRGLSPKLNWDERWEELRRHVLCKVSEIIPETPSPTQEGVAHMVASLCMALGSDEMGGAAKVREFLEGISEAGHDTATAFQQVAAEAKGMASFNLKRYLDRPSGEVRNLIQVARTLLRKD